MYKASSSFLGEVQRVANNTETRTMTTCTPPGWRPDRYIVWARYMRIYRKTYIGARALHG